MLVWGIGMKNVNEQIGQRIKEIRKVKGLTQETLSEKAEISARYLSRLEVGQQSASIETLARIAHALEVELRDLFEFGHQATSQEIRANLRKMIQETDEERLRMIFKVWQAIFY